AQIEIERIEDVRGNKRDYIIERAKKLMMGIEGSTDSRDISNQIKDSTKIAGIKDYGKNNLASGGDLEGNEIIVVEGRADVVNLVRAGINNVIGMNGTKLPDEIKELGKTKEITLYVDGDRGGRLIAQNVCENANVKYIAVAPDGKEVEELTSKEILMNLRKRVPAKEFLSNFFDKKPFYTREEKDESVKEAEIQKIEINDIEKKKLKEISDFLKGTEKASLLGKDLEELRTISARSVSGSLRRTKGVVAIVIDGTATNAIIGSAEESNIQVIVAKNFQTTDTKIKLLSF
ncbi:MAG TPA: toprim domain-containing protein, partial [Nanoarchaeota archaeon]|nr:toprim domain-containing protein [Nanoarchaeota archaeon]